MNDADWRSRVCWVVVHPDRPEVLAVEQAGGLAGLRQAPAGRG